MPSCHRFWRAAQNLYRQSAEVCTARKRVEGTRETHQLRFSEEVCGNIGPRPMLPHVQRLRNHSTRLFLQVSLDKSINVSTKIPSRVAHLIVCAMVFHNRIRMNGDSADLCPKISLYMFPFQTSSFFLPLLEFYFVQASF